MNGAAPTQTEQTQPEVLEEFQAQDGVAIEPSGQEVPASQDACDEAPASCEDAEAPAAPSDEELVEAFAKMLDRNLAMRPAAMALLAGCTGERRELAALLSGVTVDLKAAGALPVQPVSSVVGTLVRAGMLELSVEVDGEPYAGTLAQAVADDSLPEDARVVEFAQATSAGVLAQDACDDLRRALALFDRRPTFRPGLFATLQLCDEEAGRTTPVLQKLLDEQGLLNRDERTGLPGIYPSTFCNELKDVGAIAWENHAWHTTDLGRQLLGMGAEA